MKQKKIRIALVAVIFMICIFPTLLSAQVTGSVQKYPAPFLMTAAGQTPDALMVKIVAQKNKLDFTFEALAEAEDLAGKKSLVLVMGVSMKGLGSAGLDMDEEFKRIDKMIEQARKDNINIIGVFAGGAGGRGGRDELTDTVIAKVAPEVDYLVVIKTGDKDGYLRGIAEDNSIPMTYMNTIMDMNTIIPQIFK